MSEYIQSVDKKSGKIINSRTVVINEYISSISSNQLTGDFAITKPINDNSGSVVIYPPNPNNPTSSFIGEIKTLTNFSGYGFLNYPIDSQFDYIRNKIWISDAGNQRVLKVDNGNFLVDFSIANISLPHAVVPNINNGGVFIKGYVNLTTGVIFYYSSNGILQGTFTYFDTLNGSSLIPSIDDPYAINFPLPSTAGFDHRRNRFWWTANDNIYMTDLTNNQIIVYNLSSDNYTLTRGLDVDLDSGNAFITVYGDKNRWFVIQMFRDNNKILSRSYIPEVS
jgi:hypothetical protein